MVLAPGYADLAFEAPEPGSYRLPPLWGAGDGEVLDEQGRPLRLHDLLGDRLVVLSFIYTTCPDVNGCPLASYVLKRLSERLAATEGLADQVRLISLSFDPHYDRPEVMDAYGARFRQPEVDWRFLTTRSVAELDPLLQAYDQWVIRDTDEEGNPLGTMSHLLRVYLIDRHKQVRNIYSVSFLHADTVANDMTTLMMETGGTGDNG